jgi:transposase-like protein
MTKPIARDPIYRKRAFEADIIELCVRWYITYRLSYRDLVEMMAERGVQVAHSTILRWVTRYVPEFGKRWNRFSRFVGTSWRVDETYISIKAKWHYLYRAVDKHGKTVDVLLRRDRGIDAAQSVGRNDEEQVLCMHDCCGPDFSEDVAGVCGWRCESSCPRRSSLDECGLQTPELPGV